MDVGLLTSTFQPLRESIQGLRQITNGSDSGVHIAFEESIVSRLYILETEREPE
jgi:hypothetical protein